MRNIPSTVLERLESRFLMSTVTLDPAFSGGKVLHDLLGGDDFAFAMAMQSDGKILVAGRAYNNATGNDFALVRLLANGALDSTFGSGGMVTTDMGTFSDTAYAMAIQSDGKIVLAGEAGSGNSADFALVRYNANGSLDATFGSSGKVLTDFAGSVDGARGMAIMADGRIVAAGSALVAGATQVAVARYMSSGALDASFDTDGRAMTGYDSGSQAAQCVAVLSDGSVIAAGSSYNWTTDNHDFVAVKYLSNGSLDNSFGSSGAVHVDMGGDSDSAHAMLVQSTGKIVLVGDNYDSTSSSADFAMARLNANGSLDATFGTSGKVMTDFNGETDQATSVAQTSSGNLVVGGFSLMDGVPLFAVARYDANGAPDTSFAGGHTTVAFDSDAVANAVAVDSSGNILLSGFTMNSAGDEDFAVARLLVNSNVAPTANAGGPYTVAFGGSCQLNGSNSSDSDGQIVLYEWDMNYDGQSFHAGATGMTTTFSCVGLSAQTRTIALRVTDNNGATHMVTTTLTIQPAPPPPNPDPTPNCVELKDDPNSPGKKILVVHGTARHDIIHIFGTRDGKTEVVMNCHVLGKFSNISKVIAWGGDGNDLIQAVCSNVAVELHGEKGNDVLLGSRFSDVLLGGEGKNVLIGHKGIDVMDNPPPEPHHFGKCRK